MKDDHVVYGLHDLKNVNSIDWGKEHMRESRFLGKHYVNK